MLACSNSITFQLSIVKEILFLASLGWSTAVFAQTNMYAAAVDLTGGGSAVRVATPKGRPRMVGTLIDGDDHITIKFVSCTASKATHKAVFTFLVLNSAAQANLEIISGPGQIPCRFQGPQGQSCPTAEIRSEDETVIRSSVTVATNVPLKCTILLADVPSSATRLNTIGLAFSKSVPSADKRADFQRTLALRRLGRVKPGVAASEAKIFHTTLEDLPITWTL